MTKDPWMWLAAFAGPLAWFVDLVASWMLTPGAYLHTSALGIHVMTVIAVAACVLAIVYAARHRDQGFIAHVALFLAVFSLLVILAMAVPKWMLAPGAEP